MESVYEGSEGKGLFNFEGNGRCFLSRLIGKCMQANTSRGIKTYFLKVGSYDFFFSTFFFTFTFSTMTTELLSTEFLQKDMESASEAKGKGFFSRCGSPFQ